MTAATKRNFHLPLPDDLYDRLRAEAQRRNTPATTVARQAIGYYLEQQERMVLREQIAEYASACAETPVDLDDALESAAVEQLLEDDPQ